MRESHIGFSLSHRASRCDSGRICPVQFCGFDVAHPPEEKFLLIVRDLFSATGSHFAAIGVGATGNFITAGSTTGTCHMSHGHSSFDMVLFG